MIQKENLTHQLVARSNHGRYYKSRQYISFIAKLSSVLPGNAFIEFRDTLEMMKQAFPEQGEAVVDSREACAESGKHWWNKRKHSQKIGTIRRIRETFRRIRGIIRRIKEGIGGIKEAFRRIKQSFRRIKEAFGRIGASNCRIKEVFGRTGASFCRIKEAFRRIKQSFCRIGVSFRRIREASAELGIAFAEAGNSIKN